MAALNYAIRDPTLFFSLIPAFSDHYYSRALRRALALPRVHKLDENLPRAFMEHFRLNSYEAKDPVPRLVYDIVRERKPSIVVETGVGVYGESTAFILCAMHQNSEGHLFSIDLPPWEVPHETTKEGDGWYVLEDGQKHYSPEAKDVGKLVPEYLKDRWTLIRGDAKVELPILLKNLGQISIFLHDSLHTFEHMLFEYNTAWPHVDSSGFLMSHDILWNRAFLEFTKAVGGKPVIYHNFGLLRK